MSQKDERIKAILLASINAMQSAEAFLQSMDKDLGQETNQMLKDAMFGITKVVAPVLEKYAPHAKRLGIPFSDN